MNVPGFTADASLSTPVRSDYLATHALQGSTQRIVPQQIRPPRCFRSGVYTCCWYPLSGWWCTRTGGLPE
jgi:hypothetical protein